MNITILENPMKQVKFCNSFKEAFSVSKSSFTFLKDDLSTSGKRTMLIGLFNFPNFFYSYSI